MSEEISPCPSCGPGTVVEEFHPLPEKYPSFPAVICRACGMRGPRDTWNRRTPGPAVSRFLDTIKNVMARHVIDLEARVELRAAIAEFEKGASR